MVAQQQRQPAGHRPLAAISCLTNAGGPPVEVAENFIPAIYNRQSSLKVRVADLPDKNKVDFPLGKPPA
jgi:hypothetical protein